MHFHFVAFHIFVFYFCCIEWECWAGSGAVLATAALHIYISVSYETLTLNVQPETHTKNEITTHISIISFDRKISFELHVMVGCNSDFDEMNIYVE